MLRADAGTEVFRRAALFLEAWLLGVQCGAWIYSSSAYVFRLPPMVALSFAIVGVICAVRVSSRLLCAAWIVFAIQYGLQAMPLFRANTTAPWLSGALTATVALLLILAGARNRSRALLAAAGATFVAALVIRILVTRYAGLHSVMSLELRVF